MIILKKMCNSIRKCRRVWITMNYFQVIPDKTLLYTCIKLKQLFVIYKKINVNPSFNNINIVHLNFMVFNNLNYIDFIQTNCFCIPKQ